jgi:putative FmdB family regulatory protein
MNTSVRSGGKTFEVFQKISDEPLTECKVCKGKLTKLISNCAFHLKGTGWYVTDYKKPIDTVGGGKNGSKHVEKTESAPEPATVTETKTDTKAETASTASTGGAA